MSDNYNRIIERARQENLRDLVDRTGQQLGREYVRALDESIPDFEGAEEFVQSYRTAMDQFAR
jgi:predicted hydrocarbon binding protein